VAAAESELQSPVCKIEPQSLQFNTPSPAESKRIDDHNDADVLIMPSSGIANADLINNSGADDEGNDKNKSDQNLPNDGALPRSLPPVGPIASWLKLRPGKDYAGLGPLEKKTTTKAFFGQLPVPSRITDYYFAVMRNNDKKTAIRVGDQYAPTEGYKAGGKFVVVAIVRDKRTANDAAVIVPVTVDVSDPEIAACNLFQLSQVKLWTNPSYFRSGDSKLQQIGCIMCDAYIKSLKKTIEKRKSPFASSVPDKQEIIHLESADDEKRSSQKQQQEEDVMDLYDDRTHDEEQAGAAAPTKQQAKLSAKQKRANDLASEGNKFMRRTKRMRLAVKDEDLQQKRPDDD
jgi:hypothetical protein